MGELFFLHSANKKGAASDGTVHANQLLAPQSATTQACHTSQLSWPSEFDALPVDLNYYYNGTPSSGYMLNESHSDWSNPQVPTRAFESWGIADSNAGFQYAMGEIGALAHESSQAERSVSSESKVGPKFNSFQVASSMLQRDSLTQ